MRIPIRMHFLHGHEMITQNIFNIFGWFFFIESLKYYSKYYGNCPNC